LPPEKVLFTLNGLRYPAAMAGGRGSYFDLMRQAFLDKPMSLGYEAIDLDPRFAARHAQTGERFEFPADGHWNANGHADHHTYSRVCCNNFAWPGPSKARPLVAGDLDAQEMAPCRPGHTARIAQRRVLVPAVGTGA
jgi:hypothetical protein